jgi:hypothetical protein
VTGVPMNITSFETYGYQTNSGTTSSFTGLYIQVWDGDPSLPTSSVIWGDFTTNRLANSYWDNIYRVNAALNTARPVMKLIANTPGLSLAPGTYWIEFTATGSSLLTGPWMPPITINGVYTTGNAMQRTGGTVWAQMLDGTYPQGIPFILKGTPASFTWAPLTDLYSDAAATIAYAGEARDTVWSKPAATITYTATGTSAVPCTGTANAIITVGTSKTLNLKAYLEGLCDPGFGGVMRQAMDDVGPHFAPGIADQITVELHNEFSYGTIEYSADPVDLSTAGIATITTMPAALNGSYYITIKHRNSIETVSAAPVSFGGGTISYDFTTAAAKAYFDNQKDVGGGYFAIWTGDVNKDGIVDSGDMNPVDNASTAITFGYIVEDVNGDGIVDSGDMNIIDNNSTAIIMAWTP